jgi:hypothetical protein
MTRWKVYSLWYRPERKAPGQAAEAPANYLLDTQLEGWVYATGEREAFRLARTEFPDIARHNLALEEEPAAALV